MLTVRAFSSVPARTERPKPERSVDLPRRARRCRIATSAWEGSTQPRRNCRDQRRRTGADLHGRESSARYRRISDLRWRLGGDDCIRCLSQPWAMPRSTPPSACQVVVARPPWCSTQPPALCRRPSRPVSTSELTARRRWLPRTARPIDEPDLRRSLGEASPGSPCGMSRETGLAVLVRSSRSRRKGTGSSRSWSPSATRRFTSARLRARFQLG